MRKKWYVIAPFALLGLVVFTAIGGFVVQFLWNWLVPSIAGWRAITFWQAVGLLALCRILFGGRGLMGSTGNGIRRRMRDRWQSLTPEEQERFREAMRKRCGVEVPGNEPAQ